MSAQSSFTPLFIMALGAFTALEPLPAFAQCGQRKIVASDAASGNIFGFSVSVQGDRMLVGSHGSNENIGNLHYQYYSKIQEWVTRGAVWYRA